MKGFHLVKCLAILSGLLLSGTGANARVGPGFDCQAASIANQPLAQMICADDNLAAADLGYVVAFQALRAGINNRQYEALVNEANEFRAEVIEHCRIPETGNLGRQPYEMEAACIKAFYERQRARLVGRLSGYALIEASLPLETILLVQQKLKSTGFLAPDAIIDGVIGPATREAIKSWQRSVGTSPNGYASAAIVSDTTPPVSAAQGLPDEDLFRQFATLNGTCRDSSTDHAVTKALCAERDRIFAQLRDKGWCYGAANQMEFEKKWQRCLSGPLEKLLAHVPVDAGHHTNWKIFESTDGALYAVEANSLQHYKNGAAGAFVYFVENYTYQPQNFHQFIFDCTGNWQDANAFNQWRFAPPRSVMGVISEMACQR